MELDTFRKRSFKNYILDKLLFNQDIYSMRTGDLCCVKEKLPINKCHQKNMFESRKKYVQLVLIF
jgi:hypothetical protein